ncbi:hypothetical protein QFC21_003835 [Naganishia friedmannii]|uniref:Uncharacterized protein n=1 Tax=Naganishia friedmannii TaxID=89922 RepID=A0ACC2VKA0_9TREE|nr:hypothetical protein QFC21_003835 [Naganishia friedmannii]
MASVEVQQDFQPGKESLLNIDTNASDEKFHINNAASTSQECTSPTRFEAEEAQPVIHIGILKLVILGVCANLTNLTLGFDSQTAAVVFNGVALDLHIAEKDLQWIFNSLTLALGCTTLISGRIADILGRKTVYVSGIAIFGLFSLVQSPVHNPAGFFITRALSGVGAAMIFASTSGAVGTKGMGNPL